jgi:hypothetical protein
MKKFKVVFPISRAEAFSNFAFANEIHIQFAITVGAELFSTEKIHAFCFCKEDKIAAVEASEWKQFIAA